MTEHGHGSSDALQLLLDGRLAPERKAALEAHLLGCGRCRRELEALRRVKAVVRQSLPDLPEPPELAARISAALVTEAASMPQSRRAIRVRRATLAGLALAAAAVLAIMLARPGRPDFVAAAGADLVSYRAGRLGLEVETGDPREVERFFARSGVPFGTRVFDFGMMGYRLSGGRVHRIAGRVSALFAYAGSAGDRVVCQMYEASLSELPPTAEVREHNGIPFRIYRSTGLTLVFWQEGSVLCVLAADGDPEAAIQLAYAKAVKV